MEHPDAPHLARFWAKVDVRGPEDCWFWTAATNGRYGKWLWGWKGPAHYAHHWAYYWTWGVIPEGMLVMHACDQPLCCNPAHLRLGTPSDNVRDMVAKGRHAAQANPLHRARLTARLTAVAPRMPGEAHPNAKLSEAQVRAIRARADAGERHARIAADYGIKPGAVWFIAKRKTWSHLT